MTSLLSGERVPKTHPRVEACGDLDELASFLGVVAAALPAQHDGLRGEIQAVQADLLRIGALLAAAPGSPAFAMLPPLGKERIEALEHSIENMEGSLPRLQTFLIPGGHPSAAWAHVARTVCRRAERRVAAIDPAGGGADTTGGPGVTGGPDVTGGPGVTGGPDVTSGPAVTGRPVPDGVLAYLNRLSTWLFDLARLCNSVSGVADLPWKG
jgi:cob(I)alamin adenosyltransferase